MVTNRLRAAWQLIWPFILMLVLQAAVATVSMYTLSGIRSLLGGEVLWVLGQKDAVYFLHRYAATGDEEDFQLYEKSIAIPLAEREARLSFESASPSEDVMRRNFVAGGNHPEDLTAVMLLLRTFWDWELVREPVRQWRIGEHYLDDLQALAQEIRDARRALPRVDDALVHGWLSRIDKLHADMQPGILAFDASLGHTARHVVQLLLWANGLLVPCMVLFAF